MGYGGHGVHGVGAQVGERETTGYERFDMHAPIHWAVSRDVI